MTGIVGKNPQISMHYNTWCKTNSIAIVKTKGSLGTFRIDCVKVALGALAFLVACLIGAPLNFILVGIGAICLYASIKRYAAGSAGELQAEFSQAVQAGIAQAGTGDGSQAVKTALSTAGAVVDSFLSS